MMFEMMKKSQQRHDSISKTNKTGQAEQKRGDPNLTVSIKNIRDFISSGSHFLEFDVMIRADRAGTYLHTLYVPIQYESDASNKPFKKNIYTVSPTELWVDENPYIADNFRTHGASAYSTDRAFYMVHTRFGGTPMPEVPMSDVLFAHVKMKFNNSSGVSSTTLRIIDDDTQAPNMGATHSGGNYTISYSPGKITTATIVPPPVITGYYFTKSGTTTGCAGCGDILVIKGNNFGTKNINDTTNMNATLAFKLGDYRISLPGTLPYYQLKENLDYVSWSNTEIKIKLPSVAFKKDSAHLDPWIPNQNYPNQYPGTGQFKVINNGKETVSGSAITINYVLDNWMFQFPGSKKVVKYPIYIPKKNCVDGFKFQVSTDIAADDTALTCIKKAMQDWSTALGITVALDTNTDGSPKINTNTWNAKDEINTISYISTDLMETLAHNALYSSTSSSVLQYYRDFDIGIQKRNDWNKDPYASSFPSKYDFYSAFLHELGHVIGLKHVANANDLMTTKLPMGKRDSLKANVLAGGKEIVKLSIDKSIPWDAMFSNNYLTVLNTKSFYCAYPGLLPMNVRCTVISTTEIKVEWDAVPGATGYILEYSLQSDYTNILRSYSISSGINSVNITGLYSGTDYYFYVRATNSPGSTGSYGRATAKTKSTGNEYYDLYIRDMANDNGNSHNETIVWNSPDIWIRHSPDSIYTHQNPLSDAKNYIYVKIKNRGNTPSYNDARLHLYWAKASSSVGWTEPWMGNTYIKGLLMGNLIDSILIPSVLPGDSIIMEIPWTTPNADDYAALDNGFQSDFWHFCLLGRIVSSSDGMQCVEGSNLTDNIQCNNNIAQKNLSMLCTSNSILSQIIMGNTSAAIREFGVNFNEEEEEEEGLSGQTEITIRLDDVVYQAWVRGGRLLTNIQLIGKQTFLVKGVGARFQNLVFNPYEMGIISLQFNFLTRKMTEQTDYTYHLIQTDAVTNAVIGGEVYSITKSPRTLFYANAGDNIYANAGEIVTLRAADIGEDAMYRWYDQAGNLISEEMEVNVRANPTANNQQRYKLEVIALADGFKDYDEVVVMIINNAAEEETPDEPVVEEIVDCYQDTSFPNIHFRANAGRDVYAIINEVVILRAADVYEPAYYRWYNQDGELVSEEMEFELRVIENQTYRLEVISMAEGYVSCDDVKVRIIPGRIEELFPNPATENITVTCIFDEELGAGGAYLTISDVLGVIYEEYALRENPQSVDFDIYHYPTGAYLVRLICEGKIVDTKVFVKE